MESPESAEKMRAFYPIFVHGLGSIPVSAEACPKLGCGGMGAHLFGAFLVDKAIKK
ncbi:MAG: hypothetical protein GJU77_01405 [Ferrovum sp.]|jgi:hypothetical protein|nr:hypothetical protein [Ferrovum sp.]